MQRAEYLKKMESMLPEVRMFIQNGSLIIALLIMVSCDNTLKRERKYYDIVFDSLHIFKVKLYSAELTGGEAFDMGLHGRRDFEAFVESYTKEYAKDAKELDRFRKIKKVIDAIFDTFYKERLGYSYSLCRKVLYAKIHCFDTKERKEYERQYTLLKNELEEAKKRFPNELEAYKDSLREAGWIYYLQERKFLDQ